MKQCPDCDRSVGPRVGRCNCGHVFDDAAGDKARKRRSGKAVTTTCDHCDREAEVITTSRQRYCLAHCPAESIPDSLRLLMDGSGTSPHVRTWLENLRGQA